MENNSTPAIRRAEAKVRKLEALRTHPFYTYYPDRALNLQGSINIANRQLARAQAVTA